ncbi:MAG: hypothetical protein Q9160_003270 [Pyrenula sp. 1 TL-2023]
MAPSREGEQTSMAARLNELKIPKGTRDWFGADIERMIDEFLISNTITEIFKRHGGSALDTPVFELRSILAGSTSSSACRKRDGVADTGKNMARTQSLYTT